MKSSIARIVPRLVVLLGGTTLGIVLLVFLLRSVNFDQLGAALSNANYGYLGLALIPFLVNWLLKIPRWALLFGDDSPDWDTLFGAMNVGYAINALLPARLGELVRAYWVRDRAGLSMVQTLSTIALERVLDGVTLVIILLVLLPTVAFPHELAAPAITLGSLFVAALVGMIALAYTARDEASFFSRRLRQFEEGRTAPVGRALRQIVSGLSALQSIRSLLLILGYTLIIWASNALFAWLLLLAFHINVSVAAGVLLTAVLNLGMAVPSSPGYVGVFEYLFVITIGLYGVGRTPALAAALTLHVIAFGPVTIVGLIYIARALGWTVRMLRVSLTNTG